MKFLVALGAGVVAALTVALLLLLVAQRLYYGGHGLLGGFEIWHAAIAVVLLILAFGGAVAAVLLNWSRR